MYYFKSIDALYGTLQAAYQEGPGAPGREKLMEALRTRFQFGPGQAHSFASTVLGENNKTSAEHVRTNALRLVGTWRSSGSSSLADVGYGGNAISSRVETWAFLDDLTYNYSLERMTSGMSPWGSWTRPSSTKERGDWAPHDRTGPSITVLLLPLSSASRTVRIDWLGSNDDRPMACRIDFTTFQRR